MQPPADEFLDLGSPEVAPPLMPGGPVPWFRARSSTAPIDSAPPAGGACVFACTLLHQATAVTRGKRYVFVPFLYDDQAAAQRQENEKFLQV